MLHWDRPVLSQIHPLSFSIQRGWTLTAAPDTIKGPAVFRASVITAHSALDNNLWIEAQIHTHTYRSQDEPPSHKHKHWNTSCDLHIQLILEWTTYCIYIKHAISFHAILNYNHLRISEIFLNNIPSASALLSLVSFPLQFPWTLPEWSFFS